MAEEAKQEDVKQPEGGTDAAPSPEPGSPEEQAAQAAAAKKKRMMMLAAGGGLLLLILAGVGAFFLFGHKKEPEEQHTSVSAVFVDVPEFAVQIAGEGDQTHFMKMAVTLELKNAADVEAARLLLPRLQDDFNAFLLNLRMDDLRGSAGLQRVKEALLLRANQILAPVAVKNVLYKEVLVQ